MAKSKGNEKKKAVGKAKNTKPVAKSKSKPVAKKPLKQVAKPAVKASKVSKPIKKAKPVVKKKKVAAKPKAKVVAKKKAPVKSKVKVTAKKVTKVKPAGKKVAKVSKPAKVEISKKALPVVKPSAKVAALKTPKAPKAPKVLKEKQKKFVEKKVIRELPTEPKQLYKQVINPEPKPLIKKRTQIKDINMRYSDDELKEFKDLIDKKLLSARDELKYLKEALDNHNDNQAGNKAWNMEEGTDTSEMETLMNQISRQHQYIRNLELALVRIENKTYGICRITGKLIPKQRLRVVPHATLSLEAKMNRKSDDVEVAAGTSTAPPVDFAEGFED